MFKNRWGTLDKKKCSSHRSSSYVWVQSLSILIFVNYAIMTENTYQTHTSAKSPRHLTLSSVWPRRTLLDYPSKDRRHKYSQDPLICEGNMAISIFFE